MSVEAITWALKQPVKHSSAKFVLVALANCSDAIERLAWPSIAYLCEATSQDRKTVMANLKRLIDLGFIEDSGERKGVTKSVVVYRLSSAAIGIPKLYQERDCLPDQAVPFFPISSTEIPHKQSQNSQEAVPKTGHGTVKNRKGTVKEPNTGDLENQKAKFVLPEWVPADAWAGYVEMRRQIKKPMTQRAVDLRIKDLERFKAAGHNLEAILDKSTDKSWTDLYEPRTSATDHRVIPFQNAAARRAQTIADLTSPPEPTHPAPGAPHAADQQHQPDGRDDLGYTEFRVA